MHVPTVSVDEIPGDAVLLDVREDDEWQAGHIASAVHVPMYQIPLRADELTPGARIVAVCKMGGRSAQVTAWLLHNGYDAVNLDGGMLAWVAAGRPVVSSRGAPGVVA